MPSGERSSPSTSRRSTSVRRRQLLAAAGATVPLGVAGCLDIGSDSDSNDGTDGNGTESADDSADRGGSEASDDDSDSDDSNDSSNDSTDGDDDSDSDDGNDSGDDEPATWAEGGPPDRDGWEVTFFDRFEGGELDDSKWASAPE